MQEKFKQFENKNRKRRYYNEFWYLILDLKKEIDSNNHLYFYESSKYSFFLWRNKESGVEYFANNYITYNYKSLSDIPKFIMDKYTFLYLLNNPKNIPEWIKRNSKIIEKYLNLKAFL